MPPKRGLGFSFEEVQFLVDSIESILPVGGIQWDAVTSEHERQFPELRRTKEALRRKFAALYNKQMPTGDPNIPLDVLWAKRINQEIIKNAEVHEGEVPAVEMEHHPHEEECDNGNEEEAGNNNTGGMLIHNEEDEQSSEDNYREQVNVVAAGADYLQEEEGAGPADNPSLGSLQYVVVAQHNCDDEEDEEPPYQRRSATVPRRSSTSTSTSISASAASATSSIGQRQPRPSELSAFATIGGAKRIVSAGSKRKKASAVDRDEGDPTMNAMLLFAERKVEMEARRQELESAERARREEIAIRREELKSMNLFMMQMISNTSSSNGIRQQWNRSNADYCHIDGHRQQQDHPRRNPNRRSRQVMAMNDDDDDEYNESKFQHDRSRHDDRLRQSMSSNDDDNDDIDLAAYTRRSHCRSLQERMRANDDSDADDDIVVSAPPTVMVRYVALYTNIHPKVGVFGKLCFGTDKLCQSTEL